MLQTDQLWLGLLSAGSNLRSLFLASPLLSPSSACSISTARRRWLMRSDSFVQRVEYHQVWKAWILEVKVHWEPDFQLFFYCDCLFFCTWSLLVQHWAVALTLRSPEVQLPRLWSCTNVQGSVTLVSPPVRAVGVVRQAIKWRGSQSP